MDREQVMVSEKKLTLFRDSCFWSIFRNLIILFATILQNDDTKSLCLQLLFISLQTKSDAYTLCGQNSVIQPFWRNSEHG